MEQFRQLHQESFEHRVVFQESGANFFAPSPVSSTNELVTVWDPEVGRTNPSEHKQLKLARSLTRGIIDRDLKPSVIERRQVCEPPITRRYHRMGLFPSRYRPKSVDNGRFRLLPLAVGSYQLREKEEEGEPGYLELLSFDDSDPSPMGRRSLGKASWGE
ncbi:hypothetical protein BHE74_00042717 [Ensete ventricosum]|nr:hypothetical protein BHE74_00042717 [Ensete ventricosum]